MASLELWKRLLPFQDKLSLHLRPYVCIGLLHVTRSSLHRIMTIMTLHEEFKKLRKKIFYKLDKGKIR